MSILQRRIILLATLVAMIIAGPASTQVPDEFTNLKVLPEDISKRELMGIMRSFSGALGQRCNYCHVGENPNDLEGYDFASDDKEAKLVARIMMEMTNDINKSHLAELKKEHVTRVRCITCHHGVEEPETIDNIIVAVADKDGIDAAVAKYRELREEYYGAGSYDFGAGPLNSVAEKLAREKQDAAGAITIMKMNVEFNPDAAFSHLLLGQLYQMSGDNAAAIASVEKCLALDPDNRWAKDMLEKIKASE
jgi:tetratricopeptide (TPR) repeat protein